MSIATTRQHDPPSRPVPGAGGAAPSDEARAHAARSPRRQRQVRFFAGIAIGIASLATATLAAFHLHWNLAATSSLDVVVVVFVCLISGFAEATLVSLLALVSLNYYFVPPIFTFYVNDPGNWIALLAFEGTALIVSRLSAHARAQAQLAAENRRKAERLYELSRRILLVDPRRPLGLQIVALVREIIQPESIALFDAAAARLDEAGPGAGEAGAAARIAYLRDRNDNGTAGGMWQRALRMGRSSHGAIALSGPDIDAPTIDAIASLSAIAFERALLFEQQSRAEAARQTEQLRTTVLDALAHAFKTPLTVIRTASSGLLETAPLDAAATELVTLIDEESERLNQMATRLLQMARLESAEVRLRPENIDVASLLQQVVSDYREQLEGRPLSVTVSNPALHLQGDRDLLRIALGQLIDNAAKYSAAGSPVSIEASEQEGEVVVSVHNEGSVISAGQREQIFERFYRAPEVRHRASGTGLGLSITRKAMDVHRGRVWVTSEEGRGTTFFLAFPAGSTEGASHG